MRKGSDIINKVVVTYDAGKKIERIQDLIFDQQRNQLLGFLVKEKGLFRDAKVIPLQEVQAIGLDAIVVNSKESVIEAHRVPAIKLDLATAVRSSASDTWLETKVQLHDEANIAQENLKTFWQALKKQSENLQGRSTRAMKKQRIEQALGRPVTRVILDPEDNVILNVGELITHRAVRQAEESGVLNILLSSVYIKEPEISDKELRASEHGMAALVDHGNGRSQLESKSILVN